MKYLKWKGCLERPIVICLILTRLSYLMPRKVLNQGKNYLPRKKAQGNLDFAADGSLCSCYDPSVYFIYICHCIDGLPQFPFNVISFCVNSNLNFIVPSSGLQSNCTLFLEFSMYICISCLFQTD